jgi:TetR/AcrR family transcriptional regulator, regulator of autoinduction and epiphytic fitness
MGKYRTPMIQPKTTRVVTGNTVKEPRQLSPEKAEAILAGGIQEFLAHGYAATSMDRIATTAGVSKATVYSHFQDKEGLFIALIEQLVQGKFRELFKPSSENLQPEPRIFLSELANRFLDLGTNEPQFLDFMRVLIGESGRFPQLARAFVRNIEQTSVEMLHQYLATCVRLKLADPEATARIFIGAIVHFLMIQEMLHGQDIVPMARDRLINNLVDSILGSAADSALVDPIKEPRQLSPEKSEAILAGGMQEFLVNGYAATSMDRVATAAGVSKATIYSHFQDKEGLFTALIQQLVQGKFRLLFNSRSDEIQPEPRVFLGDLANRLLDLGTNEPQFLNFMRVIIGESGRFPQLARAFVRNTERTSFRMIHQYLNSCEQLKLVDPEVTARIFIGAIVHFLIVQEMLHGRDIVPMARDRLINNLLDVILGRVDDRPSS